MTTPEAQQVHIQTLYSKIDELSEDCAEQHKQGLEAIREVHRRIDDFTKIMLQLSDLAKDVQAVTTHQKSLEGAMKVMDERLDVVQDKVSSHGLTVSSVQRIAWAVAGFVSLGVGGAFFKLVGL